MPRRPVGGGGKTGIPLAAAAAGGGDKTLTVLLKIPQYLVRLRIFENGAKGHADEQILAAFAVHIFAFAVRAMGSKIMRVVTEIEERMQRGITLHDDTPAITAVSPIWPATRHILFAAKAHTAIAAFAAAYKDFRLVNEHRTLPHTRWSRAGWAGEKARVEANRRDGQVLQKLESSLYTNAAIFLSFVLKMDNAIDLGKQCIIPSHANVQARLELRSPLSHQNTPAAHLLPRKTFDPKAFADTITTI